MNIFVEIPLCYNLQMKKLFSKQKGFTLVELLVVIGIIAVLSAVVLTSLSSSRAKARDGRRVSDIQQIQLALEQYFDKCGQYPSVISSLSTSNGCTGSTNLGTFISVIPTAPSPGTYIYDNNGSSNGYTDYILHATLESHDNSINDGITNASDPFGNFTFKCDPSSPSGVDYCIGPK